MECDLHKIYYCNICIYDNSVSDYLKRVREILNSNKDYKKPKK